MRIAILADTHNRLPDGVRLDLTGADEIWHLGDICSAELLTQLRSLGPPVEAIRGNCDPRTLAPESLVLTRCGEKFYLWHEPPLAVPAGVRFALHGHTHVPRDETLGGVRYLNPGSVGKANHGAGPSFAWLELSEGREPAWTVVPLERERY